MTVMYQFQVWFLCFLKSYSSGSQLPKLHGPLVIIDEIAGPLYHNKLGMMIEMSSV